MRFHEAMKALEEGKKVRCVHWDKDLHMYTAWCGSYLYEGDCANFGDIFYNSTESKWELYEEHEKLLSFQEVVAGLKEGNKYRRKGWDNESFWIKLGRDVHDNIEDTYVFLREDFEANDWILVVEEEDRGVMPFGKHKGLSIYQLPKDYIRWVLEDSPEMKADYPNLFAKLKGILDA